MRPLLLVAPLSLLIGCAPSATPEPSPEPEAPPMAPLTGAWVAAAFGGEIHERWEPGPDGSLQKAEGYFVTDGDTSYSETVAIGYIGETTYLVAHPSTGGVMVWEQTETSATGATFENPNHDHPARIVYTFAGDSTFTRTLIGQQDGQPVVNTLRFVRR